MKEMIFKPKWDAIVNTLCILPKEGEVVKIIGQCAKFPDSYDVLGYERGKDGNLQSIQKKHFREIRLSSHASRRLAETFKKTDGVPDFNPNEKKYLPEEEVLTTEEDF